MSPVAPGNPWQNGIDELVNGRLRNACLFMEGFRFRTAAKAVSE
ncbi:hypothetical protein DRW03_35855 [Corallococcus sp. H22C18031201]|nr:hypothetical protein DRW03_35855 [Corallococcus sp. H22C18031201]